MKKLDIHTARTLAKRAPLVEAVIDRWRRREISPTPSRSIRLMQVALETVAERDDLYFYQDEYAAAASLLMDGAE